MRTPSAGCEPPVARRGPSHCDRPAARRVSGRRTTRRLLFARWSRPGRFPPVASRYCRHLTAVARGRSCGWRWVPPRREVGASAQAGTDDAETATTESGTAADGVGRGFGERRPEWPGVEDGSGSSPCATPPTTAGTPPTASPARQRGQVYSAVTPCDANGAPSTCPGPGFPPNYLGRLDLQTGQLTRVRVSGPAVAPQGMLLQRGAALRPCRTPSVPLPARRRRRPAPPPR